MNHGPGEFVPVAAPHYLKRGEAVLPVRPRSTAAKRSRCDTVKVGTAS